MLIFASAGSTRPRPGGSSTRWSAPWPGCWAGWRSRPCGCSPPARPSCGLAGRLAALLDRMGADLVDDPEPALVTEWLVQARSLRDEIERVDDTLREAADSAKLNPRALVGTAESVPVAEMTVSLRGGLEALEHAALTCAGWPARCLTLPRSTAQAPVPRRPPGPGWPTCSPSRRGDPHLRGAGAVDARRAASRSSRSSRPSSRRRAGCRTCWPSCSRPGPPGARDRDRPRRR